MVRVHLTDNGNSLNNGVMAMALGLQKGLRKRLGDQAQPLVLLSNPRTWKLDAARYAACNLPTVKDGMGRVFLGPRGFGRLTLRVFPWTGRIWCWWQRQGLGRKPASEWNPRSADIVVSLCGEDFFSDHWPMSRCLYADLHYDLLRALGIPYAVLAQTFGPFERKESATLARKHLKGAALVTAREAASHELVKGLGGIQDLHRTADLAFLMEPSPWNQVVQRHPELANLNPDAAVGISVSRWFGRSVFRGLSSPAERCEAFYVQMARALDTLVERQSVQLCFVPHVTMPRDDDRRAGREIAARMQHSSSVRVLADSYDAPDIKAVIGQFQAFIGCRMHALIAAVSQHVPTLGLAYSPKTLDVVGGMLEYPYVLDVRTLAFDDFQAEFGRLSTQLKGALTGTRDHLRNRMLPTLASSHRNIDLLLDAVAKPRISSDLRRSAVRNETP